MVFGHLAKDWVRLTPNSAHMSLHVKLLGYFILASNRWSEWNIISGRRLENCHFVRLVNLCHHTWWFAYVIASVLHRLQTMFLRLWSDLTLTIHIDSGDVSCRSEIVSFLCLLTILLLSLVAIMVKWDHTRFNSYSLIRSNGLSMIKHTNGSLVQIIHTSLIVWAWFYIRQETTFSSLFCNLVIDVYFANILQQSNLL